MQIDIKYVLGFADSRCRQLELVGGKGRNLAGLTKLGLPVPPGFCISTEGYRAFVHANGLDRTIQASLEAFDAAHAGAHATAAEQIRLAFQACLLPPELESEIESCYRELGSGGTANCRVAVRSSATAEDLPKASFAGEQVTVLNVSGLSSLYDAIRACWASLWTERAIAYRRRMGVDDRGLSMAVVVQQMVDPEVAGVLFTAEPVTGDRDYLVVEACWGLGEVLVSGQITPDHFEIDRGTLQIRRRSLSSQSEMLVCVNGGVQKAAVPARLRRRPCLEEADLERLVRMGLAVEEHFGAPQDIEWALESRDGFAQIYLLQARSITTLGATTVAKTGLKVSWESPVAGANWVRRSGGMAEYLPVPPSPLYATGQLPRIWRYMDAHGEEFGMPTPAPTWALINGYFYVRQEGNIGPATILLPIRYWQHGRKRARWWQQQARAAQLAELNLLSQFDVSGASPGKLLEHLQSLFDFNAKTWDVADRTSLSWVIGEPVFRHIFQRWIQPITGGDPVLFLRGYESQTMAAERSLYKLVRAARNTAGIAASLRDCTPEEALNRLTHLRVAQDWFRELLDYSQNYGHVTACHDYLYPTAADDLSKAVEAVQVRMELPDRDPAERQARFSAQREEAINDALKKLARFAVRRRLFCWALKWAQEGASIREDVFFEALRGWPLARRTILALGKHLAAAGALCRANDVFFLTWEELQQAALADSAGNWQATVEERRRELEWRKRLSPPPCIPIEGPPPTLSRRLKTGLKRFLTGVNNVQQEGLLRGAAVSPGTVTGPARMIQSPAQFGRLRHGDILVARATTPEWTPAFTVTAGVVTDAGGPLSHSSIVAREFGIPAVMGVPLATSIIADGQIITIDGNEGLVWLH